MELTIRLAAGLAALWVALLPGVVAAQDPAPAPAATPPAQSQLVVQQVENGWLAAPDVKFARVDGHDSVLVGGYGGWVTDRTFLVGGGAYWLANGHDGTDMAYGGIVLEWLVRTDRRIGFGARTLIGGGEATVPLSYAEVYGPMAPVAAGEIRFGGRHGGPHDGRHPGWDDGNQVVPPGRFYWNDAFFIAEPQVNVLLNLADWCRINAGVGYRLIGGSEIDDKLRGVSGTIAVQFGGGR